MKIVGEALILKDDRGVYKTSLANKELNENNEEETIFMRINVGFRSGVSVKHKTKINIKDGFLTFFRIPTENSEGEKEYKRFPKIIVMDFDVIQEGVDEVYHTKNYSENQEENNTSEDIGEISEYYPEPDDLPF